MNFRDRLGFDSGNRRLEEAIEWAVVNGFHYLDFNADAGPNRLSNWSDERVRAVRDSCERHAIHMGIHPSSAVNMAEFSPFVSEAVDEYIRAHIDLSARLGCEWIVVHGGFHFSTAREERRSASLERLKRSVEQAERVGAYLLLENHNKEPGDSEVHYQPYNVEEFRYYFEEISSDHFGWAFTANHANLVPEGIDGFLDAFGIDRIGEVRLADNLGVKEVHLRPGQGNINFESMFRRLEFAGYGGHYSLNFGSYQDMLEVRDEFQASYGNG